MGFIAASPGARHTLWACTEERHGGGWCQPSQATVSLLIRLGQTAQRKSKMLREPHGTSSHDALQDTLAAGLALAFHEGVLAAWFASKCFLLGWKLGGGIKID